MNTKKIKLILITLINSYIGVIGQYMPHKHQNQAQFIIDKIIQQSYITPEMQWTVASLDQPNYMVINKITGAVQNIPSISQLLTIINQQLMYPTQINDEQKEHLQKLAHTMLEAIQIAHCIVTIKVAYEDPEFLAYPDLLERLNIQKTEIQNTLNKINAINQSYVSWIFGSGKPAQAEKLLQINQELVNFNDHDEIIKIPAQLMPSIIQSNDYKKLSNPTQAANLLFKQCFIALQQNSNNPIPLNLTNPFGAQDYIYSNFPLIYSKYSNTYPLCDDVLLLPMHARRIRLLEIRQAIQIALWIAHKKSSANTGFQYVTSFFDNVVAELMRYDNYVAQLCKNPNYGMTPADTTNSGEWSTMSKVLAGVTIVAGTALAGAYAYDKAYGTNNVGNAYNATTGALGTTYNQTTQVLKSGYDQTSQAIQSKSQQASDVFQWFKQPSNNQPVYGPLTKAEYEKIEANERKQEHDKAMKIMRDQNEKETIARNQKDKQETAARKEKEEQLSQNTSKLLQNMSSPQYGAGQPSINGQKSLS